MIAVADTSPLNYLILIGRVGIVARLFSQLIVPEGVLRELQHAKSPRMVAAWATDPPDWARVVRVSSSQTWGGLGRGETEMLLVAKSMDANVVLVDERRATSVAQSMNLRTIGTLGLLALAADAGMLDLRDSVAALLETNFRASPELLRHVLEGRRGRFG